MSEFHILPKMIEALDVIPSARRITKYVSPNLTIKVTRRFRADRRNKSTDLVVTHGRPNAREKQFIKDCKKAGVPFPVRKLQIQHWPKAA